MIRGESIIVTIKNVGGIQRIYIRKTQKIGGHRGGNRGETHWKQRGNTEETRENTRKIQKKQRRNTREKQRKYKGSIEVVQDKYWDNAGEMQGK